MSGIDEQVEDLVCSKCGTNSGSMYLYDKGGIHLCWIDTRLRNVDGEVGFRTQTADFNDWDSVDYIECAECQTRFPVNEVYGAKLVSLMMKGTWFGCEVG